MKNKSKGGKGPAPKSIMKTNTISNSDPIENAVATLIKEQLSNLLQSSTAAQPRERLQSKRRMSDSEGDEEEEEMTSTVNTAKTPAAKKSKPMEVRANPDHSLNVQVILLEGVHENLKSNPKKFLTALRSLKPDLQIKTVRKTASGAMLIHPKEPKDCNALLKTGAFLPNSVLGANVIARLPKAQVITHQVIIKNLDTEVTEDEVKEMLQLQELPFVDVKRIRSRQRNAPTEMMRLILKDDAKKRLLLKNGIFLDQMHFKCVQAKEDTEKKLVFQCWNCQQWNDHKTFECKNKVKCVLCAGEHRKSECTKEKSEAHCTNCQGNHAAWSTECPTYQSEVTKKKTYASIAGDQVITPSAITQTIEPLLKEIMQSIKKHIAVVVAEVVSRAFLDHVYWEAEAKKTGSEKHISSSVRISSLSKWSAQAVNAAPLHELDESSVEVNDIVMSVGTRLQKVLIPAPSLSSQSQTSAPHANASTSRS